MSLFQDAVKQYNRQCEMAGVIFDQPTGMSDDEFLEALKLENARGTLARFSYNGFDVSFEGFGDDPQTD